jgi:putative membrane protein
MEARRGYRGAKRDRRRRHATDLPALPEFTLKNFMKTNHSFVAVIVAGFMAAASSVVAADAVSREDKEFLKNASELGLTEIQLGALAVQRATSPELKALGGELVAHHGKSNQELVLLAQKKGVELKTEPTRAQKQMLAEFEAKSGAEFDKELMEHVRKDHEKGIRTFADAAADSKDPEIKAFAVANVAPMREHYKMAGGKVVAE